MIENMGSTLKHYNPVEFTLEHLLFYMKIKTLRESIPRIPVFEYEKNRVEE